MSMNWLPYLKGIGIRIHTVRYQKVRKRIMTDDLELSIKYSSDDDITSKERRRIHGRPLHAGTSCVCSSFCHSIELIVHLFFYLSNSRRKTKAKPSTESYEHQAKKRQVPPSYISGPTKIAIRPPRKPNPLALRGDI